MELRNLRAFVEVVREGGFSAASKKLFATQSALSKSVKQLEEELGMALLDRGYHRIAPTAAGRLVFNRAMRMLAERDDLTSELEEMRGLKRGSLRLGLPPLGSAIVFASLYATFRKRFPGIEVQLVEHGSARLEELLRAGEVDLAGLVAPVAEEFAWQDLRKEPIVLLIAASHPLASKPSVAMKDLAETPFLLFDSAFAINQLIQKACDSAGFSPKVIARSSQVAFIAQLVSEGMGVTFLPRTIAERRLPPGSKIVQLKHALPELHLVLAWRRNGHLSHAARAWLELTRSKIDK